MEPARNLLRSLGSVYIDNLKWRDSWAFIVVKRGKKYAEAHNHQDDVSKWGEPVFARATIELASAVESSCTSWDTSDMSIRRKAFCDRFEGYGSVCSCKYNMY